MDTLLDQIVTRYKLLSDKLNERDLRLYIASEVIAYGRGGLSRLHEITGMAISTIQRGIDELSHIAEVEIKQENITDDVTSEDSRLPKERRIRRPGGGRKTKEYHQPNWIEALDKLLDSETKGDPESPIRWTLKSLKVLSNELKNQGFNVSESTVSRILHSKGFSLQSNKKTISNSTHPDRNAQFEYISNKVATYINENNPVISVDTKKKEVLGNFQNNGKKWERKGFPTKVNDHDFPDPDLPRALPFGIYDISNNYGHVVIGTDHDTSEFAANSIFGWWKKYGNSIYKNATKLLITADCGGSNGYRLKLWKYSIQQIANKIKIPISVCHFPPGTSKWNKIEHKLFSFISSNWRGEPLIDYETVVKLISSTKTDAGLTVSCELDFSKYQTGIKITKIQFSKINIIKDDFHGEWNYTIAPNL